MESSDYIISNPKGEYLIEYAFSLGNYLGDVIYFTIIAFLWTYTYFVGNNRCNSYNQGLCRILELVAIVSFLSESVFKLAQLLLTFEVYI